MSDFPAVPPEAYEAALAKWHERASAGVWTSPEEHVAALVDAAAPFLVAEGRRQAAADLRAALIVGAEMPRWARSGRPTASDFREWAARIAEGNTEPHHDPPAKDHAS